MPYRLDLLPPHTVDKTAPTNWSNKAKVCPQLLGDVQPNSNCSALLRCRPVARIWTVVLLLGTCLLYCARVAMPICAVSMAEQFGWGKRESGMVLGSFFWGYCFTQVFGGYVSDR